MNSTVFVISSGNEEWITIKNLTGFFSKKLDGCVFVSIGKSNSTLAVDAEICELIGSTLHLIPTSEEERNYMNTFKSIFNGNDVSHIIPECSLMSNRMIDGESIKVHDIDNSFYSIRNIGHVDICKIDSDNYGRSAIFNLLDAGYRPSIIMISFKYSPDDSISSQITAGHIQNTGYILLGRHKDTYVYYFVDDCLYDYCRWSQPSHKNPLMIELTSQIKELIAAENTK